MDFNHTSVLFGECMAHLSIKKNGIYVDGTLGGGGHAAGICGQLGEEGIFIGIDQDQDAIDASKERLASYPCQKKFIRRNYVEIKEVLCELGIPAIHGAVLDLGVSSFQLDNPERGFSYMQKAPLDMRMDQGGKFSAYHVVNTYTSKELESIIRKYGEERWASRISNFIVRAREQHAIEDTQMLTEIIKSAIPAAARREGPHPAKRTFQAIRIEVNQEIENLEAAVSAFCDVLGDKGRLCIISFHSLEDRIVKSVFNERAISCTCPKDFPICICGKTSDIQKVTGKPIIPSEEELELNPRSRSAKLRVIEKRGKGK